MNPKKIKSRIRTMFLKSKAVLKDKNRKSFFMIIKELTIIAVKRQCVPTHYFSDLLYRKGSGNYLDYITGKEGRRIHSAAHNPDTLQVLDNKLLFHEHFSKLGLPVPKRLAYNFKHLWFIEKKTGMIVAEVRSIQDLIALIKNLFQGAECEAVFAKPLLLSGGRGAIKISRDIFTSFKEETIRKTFYHLTSGSFIIQEYVIQHPEMSRLNASSLNTMRVVTFNSFKSYPEVISAFLRMGRSEQVVDNMMSGGIIIGIDLNSGNLRENALAKLEHGGMVYSKHPDSDVEFKDFTIPYFSKVKEIACEAASSISEKLVGWDIGVTPEGPILIEGNGYFELQYPEMTSGGYRGNPVFRKFMSEAGI